MRAIDRIIEHLRKHGSTSQTSLTRAAGVNSGTVTLALRRHRKSDAQPRIRIAECVRLKNGAGSPVYELSDAPDVELPDYYLRAVACRVQGNGRRRDRERRNDAIRAAAIAEIDASLRNLCDGLATHRSNPFRTSIVMQVAR